MEINKIANGLGVLALSLGLLTSCSGDEDENLKLEGKGELLVTAKATYSTGANKAGLEAKTGSNIEVNQFLLNIKEIELELDDDMDDDDDQWDNDGYFDGEDEIELQGPFELNLLDGEISLLDITVPNGIYEELEFEFDKSEDDSSELFGKSVLVKGTIDGTSFVFWHDFEEDVEVDFEDAQTDIIVESDQNHVEISFDLSKIINATSGVNLAEAKDGNEDGVIEISPEDNDGNNELAERLKELIKDYVDLLDD